MAEGARLESVFTRKGNVGSNPTLSAILLKINKLRGIPNPLSRPLYVFGMSDMQFCKAEVRAIKDKTDHWNQGFDRRRENLQPQVVASASGTQNKKPHRRSCRLRFMACRFAAHFLGWTLSSGQRDTPWAM